MALARKNECKKAYQVQLHRPKTATQHRLPANRVRPEAGRTRRAVKQHFPRRSGKTLSSNLRSGGRGLVLSRFALRPRPPLEHMGWLGGSTRPLRLRGVVEERIPVWRLRRKAIKKQKTVCLFYTRLCVCVRRLHGRACVGSRAGTERTRRRPPPLHVAQRLRGNLISLGDLCLHGSHALAGELGRDGAGAGASVV